MYTLSDNLFVFALILNFFLHSQRLRGLKLYFLNFILKKIKIYLQCEYFALLVKIYRNNN